MKITENVSLLPYNSFHIDAKARYVVEINSVDDLRSALQFASEKGLPYYIINGGCNILLSGDLEKVVLLIRIKGINVLSSEGERVQVRVQAGEDWPEFVNWAVDQGYGGLENLSFIPGHVGSAPVQNIGAYGAEAKDTIYEVEVYDIRNDCIEKLSNVECEFGYRESVFKHKFKGHYIITAVTFSLVAPGVPYALKLSYGNIQGMLDKTGIASPTIKDVAQAVTAIRKEKLPDPAQLGNAGSFFKNSVISQSRFDILVQEYPDAPSYPAGDGMVKVPTGWLIEKAGWKGFREGEVGVHRNQALVLVNYGKASGPQVLVFCKRIVNDIRDKFGISIEPEVNIVS